MILFTEFEPVAQRITADKTATDYLLASKSDPDSGVIVTVDETNATISSKITNLGDVITDFKDLTETPSEIHNTIVEHISIPDGLDLINNFQKI